MIKIEINENAVKIETDDLTQDEIDHLEWVAGIVLKMGAPRHDSDKNKP